jgi:hypothetical protein
VYQAKAANRAAISNGFMFSPCQKPVTRSTQRDQPKSRIPVGEGD